MKIPLAVIEARPTPVPETALDHPREWVEFAHPEDPARVIRADLTWLLSRWQCIYGAGCHGIEHGLPDAGCCALGAHFSDKQDEKRVRAAVRRLNRGTWQHHRRAFADYTTVTELHGEPATRTASRPDGACIFLNDDDFPGGGGCALHGQALRDGVHPLDYKPAVCWQVPMTGDEQLVERADETEVIITTVGEYDRRRWGAGGHSMPWWCSSSPEAHTADTPLYLRYRDELRALLGEAAHRALEGICDARAAHPLIAEHPATAAARRRDPA